MCKSATLTSVLLTTCLWAVNAAGQLVDSAGVDLLEAPVVYTLTNLHPDEARARLYAVNYQQPGLIPRCTEVRISRLRRNRMTFVVLERNREYDYYNHDAAAEPFENHLLRFFGTACDEAAIAELSEADQAGIRAGIAEPGMSRQGVIYAIGYPPRHVNPSLESGDWTYWWSRFNRFIVEFDSSGIVVNVRD